MSVGCVCGKYYHDAESRQQHIDSHDDDSVVHGPIEQLDARAPRSVVLKTTVTQLTSADGHSLIVKKTSE